ncbi:MAG: DUF2507 domain-containing protein [Brevibacillus sp.]|nr:DUF2507 domain-containing protein [Brevibacillus sp.]
MNRTGDPLAPLLSSATISHIEQMNMPYLGYHLLRETLSIRLLGESEAPILYWTGKDLGRQMAVGSAADLVMTFIRLGLGRLEIMEQTDSHLRFRLSHSAYDYIPPDRLVRTLSLEAGLLAGAVGAWQTRRAEATLGIRNGKEKRLEAVITVQLDKAE